MDGGCRGSVSVKAAGECLLAASSLTWRRQFHELGHKLEPGHVNAKDSRALRPREWEASNVAREARWNAKE